MSAEVGIGMVLLIILTVAFLAGYAVGLSVAKRRCP